MKLKTFLISFGAAMTLASSALAAEPTSFGDPGQFVVSGERLFGVMYDHSKASLNGQSETSSTTSIAVLGNAPESIWNVPRLGFDVFVAPGVSVGGSFTYLHVSSSSDSSVTTSVGTGDSNAELVLFSPRVGYAYMFNDVVGVWPRAGFSYGHISSKDSAVSLSATAIPLEAMLVVTPVRHFAFTVGPVVDVGLGGSADVKVATQTVSTDYNATSVGVVAGLLGYF